MKNQTQKDYIEKEPLRRRDFLKTMGIVALSMQVLPLAKGKADEVGISGDHLTVLSGKSRFAPLSGHLHYLEIKLELFRNPPVEGVKLKTSWAYYHHHNVKLTQEQLVAISKGQVVTVPDTVRDHLYQIRL